LGNGELLAVFVLSNPAFFSQSHFAVKELKLLDSLHSRYTACRAYCDHAKKTNNSMAENCCKAGYGFGGLLILNKAAFFADRLKTKRDARRKEKIN
jgi:hypothetical protein